jgi:segregation and condensation protein B
VTRAPRAPRVKKASPRPRAVPTKEAAPLETQPEADLAADEGVTVVAGEERLEDAPVADDPVTDAPVADDPVTDEPVADETVADATASHEPATREAADESVADDGDTEDATAEESQPTLALDIEPARLLPRVHLRGLLEALVFASDKPMTAHELAKLASAPLKEVKEILGELRETYAPRGITLGEVAGGWLFRTNAQFAPFVRELTGEKPVRLSRAQLETLAIAAYRQPITRPEIDEIRGVDSGATMKLLLERELLRILGKKDEPGRPLLYGTTPAFLEFFGLKSLKELPTLREFAELSEESRAIAEAELGEVVPAARSAPAADPVESTGPLEAAEPNDHAAGGGGPPDAALLADAQPAGERPGRDGEDGSAPPGDDAALADVDERPAADDTSITDPERILGGNE